MIYYSGRSHLIYWENKGREKTPQVNSILRSSGYSYCRIGNFLGSKSNI